MSTHPQKAPKAAKAATPAPAKKNSAPTVMPTATAAPVATAAGNQQVLQALGLRAKLSISQPSDPEERDADRAADAFVAGMSSPGIDRRAGGAELRRRCTTCEDETLHRKSDGAGNTAGGTHTVARAMNASHGQPMAPGLRRDYERFFGSNLASIRLHTGDAAQSAARSISAQAFTRGNDIYFDRGRFEPHTREGRHLLAHELTHAVQGHAGIHRQEDPPNMTRADATYSIGPPPGPNQSSLLDTARAEHDASYNPCNVVVGDLTNYMLLAEYNGAMRVVNQGRGATGYFDYRNLQRRLIAERDRRVGMGHAWLATMPSAIPETLYRIVDGPDGTFTVEATSGATVTGAPTDISIAPLMTRVQFDRFLETRNVERVNAETYRLRMREQLTGGAEFGSLFTAGAGLYNSPLDFFLRDPYARPILGTGGGEIMKWRGRFGEAGYGSQWRTGFGLTLEDLNSGTWTDRRGRVHQPTEENFPIFDFERTPNTRGVGILGTARISVKTSLQPDLAGRLSYFREGLHAMFETGSTHSMQSYVSNQAQFAGQPTTGPTYEANRSQVLSDALLAVNDDDVAAFRRLLSDPTARETSQSATSMWQDRGQQARRATATQPAQPPRSGWRQIFEGEMRENPVSIDTPNGRRTFNSPDALDLALRNGQITTDQHAAAQREVGRRVSGRIVGAGMITEQIAALRNSRLRFGSLTQAQLEPLLTTEFMRAERMGGGVSGNLRAGGAAGLQGAGVGGLLAVFTTGGIMLIDEANHPNWQQELGIAGGMGMGGGFVGSATEQILISTGSRLMISSAAGETGFLTSTVGSRLTPGLATGLGRFGGGAAGAMFLEGISMGLLEEREHSGLEIGTRLARTGVIGGSSVWAGAAIGTAVGGPIGFIVGLAIGGLLYYVGDKLVPGGREDWDAIEAGCQPLPTVTRITTGLSGGSRPYESMIFACFEAGTPIVMADGTVRPIATIAIGDLVLSYNERTRTLEPRHVTKVHEAPPAVMLRLICADGSHVLVTPTHKLASPAGWRPAMEYRVGDALWSTARIAAVNGGAWQTLVTTVIESIEPVAPRGTVYDLSIDETHTYFAGGLLAHNKLP